MTHNNVKSAHVEPLPAREKGILITFDTDSGPISLRFKKHDARLLMSSINMALGFKRGEGVGEFLLRRSSSIGKK